MKKRLRDQIYFKMKASKLRLAVFDFDGVFTDNRVLIMQDGTEGVVCSRADGLGLEQLRQFGLKLYVISTEKNPVVRARCRKLSLPLVQGCKNKAQTLKKIAAKEHIPLAEISYMGNDINDLECMEIVGLSVCVADAHPDVQALCTYRTQALGGNGAVREFCEKITEIRQKSAGKRNS